jgi:SpoU rRNA methylase family enzyme
MRVIENLLVVVLEMNDAVEVVPGQLVEIVLLAQRPSIATKRVDPALQTVINPLVALQPEHNGKEWLAVDAKLSILADLDRLDSGTHVRRLRACGCREDTY